MGIIAKLLIILVLLPPMSYVSAADRNPLPYLMMVTFYANPITKDNLTHVRRQMAPVFNQSAYDGIAVFPIDGRHRWDGSDFIWLTQTGITKHIWPWVFINRFCGYRHSAPRNKFWFQGIKGMDLYNETGALQDFYNIFQNALRVAKKMGSPGIVIDPELYNDYHCYNVAYVGEKQSKTSSEVVEALRAIGNTMADMVNQNHPNGTIWLFFAPLHQEQPWTTTEIVIGMLNRAKNMGYNFKIVAGGSHTLGYCEPDLESLNSKIISRGKEFKTYLSEYPHILKLGGTIAPWPNENLKKGWLLKGACGSSNLKGISDFAPLLGRLMRVYDYVWIYSDGATGYDPFNAVVAFPCDTVFRRVKEEEKARSLSE